MHSAVTFHGVSLELPNGHTLFNDLNFTLSSGITALVGPNGVGKSTLARLIVGDLSPTRGTIHKNRSITFFRQRESPPEVTVEEYLSIRYSWSVLGDRLLEGVDRNQICSKLSGGQWMRVRLASTIDDQFLILDEPSNDLDREGKDKLLEFLREYRFGILMISHDREFLYLCDEVLELSNQGLEKYGGGFAQYESETENEKQMAIAELDRAKGERAKAEADRIAKLERQDRRNRRGRQAGLKGGMPKILLGARKRRAQASTGKIDSATMERANEKVKAAFDAFVHLKVDPVMYAGLTGKELPAQKLVAEAQGYNLRFSERWLYKNDLNFSWRGPARIAIKGGNGSGKSTLIKAILGTDFHSRGELRSGHLVTLYLDQQCSVPDESKSVFENVRGLSSMSESQIRNHLAQLLFSGDSVFQSVQSLSGGEKMRAALACGLLSREKPELIVFDEPTNNLDLQNIKFLEQLISQFKGAVVIISHDEVFLKECRIEKALDLDC